MCWTIGDDDVEGQRNARSDRETFEGLDGMCGIGFKAFSWGGRFRDGELHVVQFT